MEGAASAANSRSTSHAASRAQSPDLPSSQHVRGKSPRANFQHECHLLVQSSSELQSGRSSPLQQQLPATYDAADSDFSQAVSQPGSLHSSPAVSKQQCSSHSVNTAAAAQASLAHMDTTSVALLSPETSATESKKTDEFPVKENPNSDATLSQQSHDLVSYAKVIMDTSSRSDDMLRKSDNLGHSSRSRESSPDILQMRHASSMAGPEPDLCPHEPAKACTLPQVSSLHSSASLPSMGSQSSYSSEYSLHSETALQAPVGPEASCSSNGAQCSASSVSNTAAEAVAIPAAPVKVILDLGCSPANSSSNSSCRRLLDGKALPPGGHASTGTLLCSQAPVSTSKAVEDSRNVPANSSASPATGSSSAAVMEADTGPSFAPAQLCLPSDTTQAEAAPLQHASEHSVELESLLSQIDASQSATSQSGSSNQVSHQTEQSRSGQRGASPQEGSSASSNVSGLAADQPDQTRFSSKSQVCKRKREGYKQNKEILTAIEGPNWLCVQKQSGLYAHIVSLLRYRSLNYCFFGVVKVVSSYLFSILALLLEAVTSSQVVTVYGVGRRSAWVSC